MVDYTFKISDEIDTSGPFKSAFQASTEGVIRQEFITYRMRDGMMIKEVNVRKYTPDDYIDSKDVIPLGEIGK
jgi:predicted peptidase